MEEKNKNENKKNIKKNKNIMKKIAIILLILILIAGIAMIVIKGFNFGLRYQKSQRIQLFIDKEFQESDVRQITNEVFGNQSVMIQKVEVYGDSILITTNQITDEQKANLVTKVNEKYGTELKAENIEITNIGHTRGRDIIKPYIAPFVIATVISLIYIGIRYHKIGAIKTILKSIAIIIIAQAELFAIMALTRIPIGRLTIPLVIVVYLLTLVGITSKFEKQLQQKKLEVSKKTEE